MHNHVNKNLTKLYNPVSFSLMISVIIAIGDFPNACVLYLTGLSFLGACLVFLCGLLAEENQCLYFSF